MDKKLFTALAFAYKTLDYEKDPNPDNWITIKGTHTHLEGGKINGGAGGKFNGKGYTGTKKQAHVGKSTEEKQAGNLPQEEKKEPETKTKSKQGTTKSLSGASMEKVTQAFYNAYQNEKDEKVKQELKMWHDVAKDDPDGEYKGDTVKFLRDVIEGLNWDKGVNKYNPKENAITDKKRKALLKIINGLKETGSKANAKKEEWRKNNRQLKLFDRKPKR